MAEKRQFPHIQLKLTKEGRAKLTGGGRRKTNPRTDANRNNRDGHGRKLETSRLDIIADWKDTREKREEEDKPPLPEVIPLLLQTDPEAFEAEELKSFGIEVIAELEDGYIIGASVNDPDLTKLQKKIEKFIKEEHGGGNNAEIWDFLNGTRRPEYILSPELLEQWSRISDEQIYTVDVGVACLGEKSQLPDYPKKKDGESDDSFSTRKNRWMNKRKITYEEWDECKCKREEELEDFVGSYQGIIFEISDGKISKYAELPDSFSCRIQISGKGLRDLVLNFPYIFEVAEPDQFAELVVRQGLTDEDNPPFQLEPPAPNAPKVCVIDSGIQERHPLLRAAIDEDSSLSWIGEIDQTADLVSNGGHGTRVAGAVLYPRTVPRTGRQQAIFWIQNARVLDADCKMPKRLFPANLLGEIVEIYHGQTGTRIFNHSIAAVVPCRKQYMSAWASAIDQLTWQNDILFVVAAGNIEAYRPYGVTSRTRLSVKDHLAANRPYPDYLLEGSCRIANPAQSLMALTVGSIARDFYSNPQYSSFAQEDRPSAFSRSGLGIWKTIKPEVVEYGGDLVTDGGNPPNIICPPEVCPELVRSTLGGGPTLASDGVGTSFAAPKVSHIAACIAAELPNENCLLYRGLIVQSARWPAWAENSQNKKDVICHIGYGIPSLDRALENTPKRITLITRGINIIKVRDAHVYEVKLPKIMQSQGEIEILVEVTLSYKAQPRRTRRNRRKYLSTWLDWDCSQIGEDPEIFKARILNEYDAPEDAEKGEGIFSWTLGKRRDSGLIKEVSRGAGTIQKDWAYVKSHQLRKAFCIGVVGHPGWNNEPEAQVPYSLVVSFEATQADLPIYASVVEAQQLVEQKVANEIEV